MTESSELWHPDRLATVGWIMDRYSEHLQPNDRIRIGQEGDPCSSYRSASESPCARVDNIHKDSDGTVRFRAVFEESGEAIELDNRNISPNRIWELHPNQVDEFRGRVERATHQQVDEPEDDMLQGIQTRIVDMEYRGTAMEKTIGGAIRELAGDLMRVHSGKSPSFSIRFAGDYDDTIINTTTYQGSRRDKDTRHDFTAAEEVSDVDDPQTDRHLFDDFSGIGYSGEVQAVNVGSNDE